ncbi:MAG: valine--pyruvate transaminase [Planctomycetota bacterium]
MDIQWSEFAQRLGGPSGINELMEDLGDALARGGEDLVMMGGGNPAHIAAVEAVWRQRLGSICADPVQLAAMLGDYDTPRGNAGFLETIAAYFAQTQGWPISERNVAITPGSQTGAFLLFNALASAQRPIGFPLVPEYIGYADQLHAGHFVAPRPLIETHHEHRFEYRCDFAAIEAQGPVAAIACSRPTNPSANVLGDAEVDRLSKLCRARGSLLYLDNAYGLPFPGVVFGEHRLPAFAEHIVYSFSLSKVGLPNTRTGIIVASEAVIERLSRMNAVVGLANGTVGQAITAPLFADGTIDRLVREVVRPYYRQRCEHALASLDAALAGLPYRVHEPQGAFFLWLWLPELRISDHELYERLKRRGVIVVPGHYFFAGLEGDWLHRSRCLRISYCQDPARIERGMAILGEEVRRASR